MLVLVVAALACAPAAGAADPGDVDVSFGPGGVAYALPSPQPATAWGVTVTRGGAVIAAGVQERPRLNPQDPPEWVGALVRWTPDGVVDPTFGLLGSAPTPGGAQVSTAPAQRPSGGFVTGGTLPRDRSAAFATLAFGDSGQPDPTFGDVGVSITGAGSAGEAIAQPDGKVVTVGAIGSGMIALVRHDRLGRLDQTFGEGGIVRTRLVQEGGIAIAHALARQPDGRIVVAAWGVDEDTRRGIADPSKLKSGWFVLRYRPDGTLDPTFGDGGIVRDPTGPSALNVTNHDVAIQPDGRILVAGSASKGNASGAPFGISDTYAAVIRYRPDGTRDTGFGRDGIAALPDVRSGRAVAIQPDGRIVLGAYYEKYVDKRWDEAFALGRFRADGRPDTSFGHDGLVLTRGASAGTATVALQGIVDVDLQGDRILATGPVKECGHGVFAVIAYHAAESPLPAAAGPQVRLCTPKPEAEPDGDLPIDLGCPALERLCDGDITVELPGGDGVRVPVAKARFRARGGRARTAEPRLPKAVRKTLDQRRKLKATVLIRARNHRGRRASVRRRIVMRAAP